MKIESLLILSLLLELIFAVVYMEILGIICGQVSVGIEGDWIGRKFGLVQDAVIMFFGVVLLTAVWGATLQGWVIAYAISLFVYSFGVGGEFFLSRCNEKNCD